MTSSREPHKWARLNTRNNMIWCFLGLAAVVAFAFIIVSPIVSPLNIGEDIKDPFKVGE